MTGGWGKALATGLASAVLAVSGVARAQDNSGLVLTGDVTFGVELDDNRGLSSNPRGTDSQAYADVTVGAFLETPTTQLSFDIGGSLQRQNFSTAREENGFRDPFTNLNLVRRGPGSELRFRASYRQSDIVDSLGLDLDGDLIDETFLRSIGEREFTSVRGSFEIGTDAPVGARIELSRRDTNFRNQINPDVFDRRTDLVRLSTVLRPRRGLTFGIFGEREEYNADDVPQTDRTTDRVGVSVDYDISPILTFSGSVSNDDIETTTLLGTTPTTGTSFALELEREVPDGAYRVFANRVVSDVATRSAVGVSRSLVMPGALLDFTIGVSDSDVGDSVFFAGLDYLREFPTGILTASLSQDTLVNDDSEEVRRSLFEIDYQHDLTSIESIAVGFVYVQTDDIGVGAVDEGSRTDLEIVYSRAVTEDWNWEVGFRNRRTDPSTGASASSNAIFTTFGRSFSLRP